MVTSQHIIMRYRESVLFRAGDGMPSVPDNISFEGAMVTVLPKDIEKFFSEQNTNLKLTDEEKQELKQRLVSMVESTKVSLALHLYNTIANNPKESPNNIIDENTGDQIENGENVWVINVNDIVREIQLSSGRTIYLSLGGMHYFKDLNDAKSFVLERLVDSDETSSLREHVRTRLGILDESSESMPEL